MGEELARKLKEARARLGLSQSQAAKAWGIPLDTLKGWENSRRTPRGIALRLLTEKLDGILASAPAPKASAKRAKPKQ